MRNVLVVTPILFGALATWKALADSPTWAAVSRRWRSQTPIRELVSGIDCEIGKGATFHW
jgi:hypothetical protein